MFRKFRSEPIRPAACPLSLHHRITHNQSLLQPPAKPHRICGIQLCTMMSGFALSGCPGLAHRSCTLRQPARQRLVVRAATMLPSQVWPVLHARCGDVRLSPCCAPPGRHDDLGPSASCTSRSSTGVRILRYKLVSLMHVSSPPWKMMSGACWSLM